MGTLREWWSLDRFGVSLLGVLVAGFLANAVCFAVWRNPVNVVSGLFAAVVFGICVSMQRGTIASLRELRKYPS